ncbi:hypothetical protein JCM10207_000781 [Rhodosporidiobolus poonsookiae]
MDGLLLYLTLAFALLSFFCSTYTTLRTLLPLLPGHPLNRRHANPPVGPYPAAVPPVEKHPRLKSAQRFTAYLATVDILAACILVWEVATAASLGTQLGDSRLAASRVYLATTARPTLLLVVAALSYINVVQGRQIALGRADWIVWLPALGIYAAGAGLASLGRPGGRNVWLGLVCWLSAVAVIVTACFGRLLVAILRVRRLTYREQAISRFASEQEKVISQGDMPYLPRSKFSDLSTSFVCQIGRSQSSLDLSNPRHILPYTADTRSAVSYAPSRPSTEDLDYDPRTDFRSPTPGSAHRLLERSATSTPSGLAHSIHFSEADEPHEVLSETAESRRVSLSSFTSRASTYLQPGGFIGNSVVRQALVQEAWGTQTPPGSGHSPKVELSQREARGAMVRIGGHLACALLGYALTSPFAFSRLLRPSSTAPLATSILLVLGVCQPGFILAWQCWASEGFWYRTPDPPVLTSTSALAFEKFEGVQIDDQRTVTDVQDRSQCRASTVKTLKSFPGIPREGEDCAPVQHSRFGRALSMLEAHPRLQVLPAVPVPEPSSTASGFVKAATTGHARLRSLKLSKATITSVGEFGRARTRTGSVASRKTVGGFEHHARNASAPVNHTDTLIAMSLLKSRRSPTPDARPPSREQVPFGFSGSGNPRASTVLDVPQSRSRSRSPSPLPSPSVYPTSSTPTADFAFLASEFALSPTVSSFPSSGQTPTAPPSDLTIDFLSAQLLPQLVPSIKVGKDVKVGPEDAPLTRRRSSTIDAEPSSTVSSKGFSSMGSKRSRNKRNLSLPLFALPGSTSPIATDVSSPSPQEESWLAIDTTSPAPDGEKEAAAFAALADSVRNGNAASRHLAHKKSRGDMRWDEVEAQAPVQQDEHEEEAPSRPSQVASRRRSTATILDISFDWENNGATEVLDDLGALADAEDAGDDDDETGEAALAAHQRARRAASPLSPLTPTLPLFSNRPPPSHTRSEDGSIVLRGSQVFNSSDEDDARTGTIHCATVRPIARDSDLSGTESPAANFGLRPTHLAVNSLSSARSFQSTASSITAPGFLNSLRTGTWHRSDDSGASSDEPTSSRRHSQPRPTSPPVQPGHRPLSLLGQRDINSSYSASLYSSENDSDAVEAQKVERHRAATAERDQQQPHAAPGKRWSRHLPPLPGDYLPEIEEADEDAKSRKSGTPTPRSKRSHGKTPAKDSPRDPPPPLPLPPTPLESFSAAQPTKTPPNVTSRTRTRRLPRDGSESSAADNDENVRPAAASGAPRTPRRGPVTRSQGPANVRSMR